MPPYQPPGAPPPPTGGPGFEASEPLSFAWNAISKDYAGIGLPLVVACVVASIPQFIVSGARAFAVTAMTASGSVDPSMVMLINGGGGLVGYLIGLIAQAYVLGGVTQFSLQVVRGQKPEFGTVFGGGRFFAPMLGSTLIFSICSSFGLVACIVPGLFLIAGWIAFSAFVVDKGSGAIESLKASWQATTPYRTTLIVYVLLAWVAMFVGALACCVGVVLVSVPVVIIGNAYVYLKLIGEQPRLPGA
jgi:uncharacterized membrane protein